MRGPEFKPQFYKQQQNSDLRRFLTVADRADGQERLFQPLGHSCQSWTQLVPDWLLLRGLSRQMQHEHKGTHLLRFWGPNLGPASPLPLEPHFQPFCFYFVFGLRSH
jgi:hypothetical protein